MAAQPVILLFVGDRPVLSSLQFSLAIEGFDVADGMAGAIEPCAAAALVIDQAFCADAFAMLAAFRRSGCITPAIVLATNPTTRARAQAAATGVALIEKPLLGDELTRALRAALEIQEAA